MELKFKAITPRDFLKTCPLPMALILLMCTLFLVFSNELAFLVG